MKNLMRKARTDGYQAGNYAKNGDGLAHSQESKSITQEAIIAMQCNREVPCKVW